MLIFLWAEGHDGVIGQNGQLPWHLPADMHFFKTATTGHTVIAGAKTFASFKRPLPNRTNVVVTHQAAEKFPDEVVILHSIEAIRGYARERPTEKLFVVGGAQIFAALLDDVDWLYRTVIDADFRGDTWMPAIDYDQFNLVKCQTGMHDAANPYDYRFEQYQRN
ncbi:dihydrofolate reductase [Levilactobacillus senmaizukei DSM 21775 = NBRC 103853]|uniref:Dihydrofolate reductase n=1 Tax=Levilactobacillus senmaizukei DSM 21775 = NBRC 103853 TaxID=1423803 RepID=A0A0R2DP69_9LACO|nr:dihydrofolate reductase [Levilactobacillus senmaizukei]KRN02551.1 dihydrofolate reductase [Levilactobacillus senmaizukei DSM 21775 = NBRC 103853]